MNPIKSFNRLRDRFANKPEFWTLAIFAATITCLCVYMFHRLLWLQTLAPRYPGYCIDFALLITAGMSIVALSCWQLRSGFSPWRAILAGALLGLIFFVSTLGFALVDPTNITWLLHGDWGQHFVGWHLYRSAPWQWPPGAFNSFWYPVGTAIVYTDSLPLLAIPLKLISQLLPLRFQYIGFWLMLNFALQGLFGVLLLRCFTKNFVLQVLGSGLLLITPIFVSRVAHDTLTTQWLLLAGFWMYFRDIDSRQAVWTWLIFTGIAALVHPYLSAMLLALVAAFYMRVVYVDKTLRWRLGSLHVAALIGLTALCWYLSGAFTLKPNSGNVHFGIYSANLVTWIDPDFMSRWMPTIPLAGGGQFEGRGYLGIGVLALSVMAIPLTLWRKDVQPFFRTKLRPLLLVVIAMSLFAFSTRLTFGHHILLDITPKHLGILGAFRSSGRFIWPSVYLISTYACVIVIRRAGKFAVPLFCCAFLVQLYELAPLHLRTATLRLETQRSTSKQELHDEYWNTATIGRKHITLVPPPACGKPAAPYLPFSLLAGDHAMTINTGHLARWNISATSRYCKSLKDQLHSGERDPRTLYIVSDEKLADFRATSRVPMQCRRVEGYTACIVSRTSP